MLGFTILFNLPEAFWPNCWLAFFSVFWSLILFSSVGRYNVPGLISLSKQFHWLLFLFSIDKSISFSLFFLFTSFIPLCFFYFLFVFGGLAFIVPYWQRNHTFPPTTWTFHQLYSLNKYWGPSMHHVGVHNSVWNKDPCVQKAYNLQVFVIFWAIFIVGLTMT